MGRGTDYKCPLSWDEKYGAETYRLGWIKEAIQEGTNYLKLQRAYPLLDKAIDVISGIEDNPIPQALSDIYVNRLRRQAREVVATLSNLRPMWGYKTDNELFQGQADVLNKISTAWWQQTRADRAIKKALQWACVSTGYISPVWEKDFWTVGRGDIGLHVYGPRDVLPIQMPKNHSLQQAYAVIICSEVPIQFARMMNPAYADKLQPTRDTPTWYTGMMGRLKRVASRHPRHIMDILGGQKEDASPSGPTVDIYNIYIMDPSVNFSNKPIRMGKPGTSWYYEVPYYGQSIPSGYLTGAQTRPANEEDARIFPLRRLITCTDTFIMYDDTSYWWHGMVPIVKFTLDSWPDQFLGYSVIHDAHTLQRALNANLRAYQDYVSGALRPTVTYDPNGSAKSHIQRFDPRVPGVKIPRNAQMGEEITFLKKDPLPVNVLEFHELLKQEMDHLMAIPDMKDLARANQIPSQETLEKLLEIAGPVVQDISREMEDALIPFGEMTKGLFYQFYRAPRKVSLLGKDGFTQEDFKFEPGMLIPSDINGMTNREMDALTTFIMPDSVRKAKLAMNTCLFHITPGSLHQITQTQHKLFLLQFWRDGKFPIDPQTVAEAFDLPSFGELPGSPRTIMERWQVWQQIMTKIQLEQQQQVMQAQMQMQQQQQMQQVTDAVQQMGGAAALNQAQGQEGRKPSAQKPPHLENKDGGTRQTISES